MAIKVKSAADVTKKWLEVTPGRASYYEAGATGAGDEWQKNTAAAASAYKSAVSAANIGTMFSGGVVKAGAAKYNRKVKDVGVSRFGQGVQAAGPDFSAGVGPMLETIAGLTLSARGPRGSASNITRVTEVATALNKKRLSLRALGG